MEVGGSGDCVSPDSQDYIGGAPRARLHVERSNDDEALAALYLPVSLLLGGTETCDMEWVLGIVVLSHNGVRALNAFAGRLLWS